MKSTLRPELALAALRIYLTYVLQEAEELMNSYKLRLSFAMFEVEKFDWNRVIDAAARVVLYIQNCRYDDQINCFSSCGAHGLCAIEAAQDALVSTLRVANACREKSERIPMHDAESIKLHTNRAKYIVNSITALHRHELDLAALWHEAVQRSLLQSQRRPNNASLTPVPTTLFKMSEVTRLAGAAAKHANQEAGGLFLRAARNYRLFVVHAVLGKTTGYDKAAARFESAAIYSLEAGDSVLLIKSLWNKVSVSMGLAAEMMEKEALVYGKSDMFSSALTDTLQIVDANTRGAAELGSHIKHLNEMEIKCNQWPSSMPTKNRILEMLSHVWQLMQQYVDQSPSILTDESVLQGRIYDHYTKVRNNCRIGDTILLHMKRAEYYRAQITKCNYLQHTELRGMWVKCWIRAAECVDEAVRLKSQHILENGFMPFVGAYEIKMAQRYEYCATCLINTAVQYYNSARGAQGLRCDPREEQWWRAAANIHTQIIAINLEHIPENTSASSVVSSLPPKARDLQQEADHFVTGAECLEQSRMYNAMTDTSLPTQRIARLYVFAAEASVTSVTFETLRSTADACLLWAEKLASGEALCALQQDMIAIGCEYMTRFWAALQNNRSAAEKWLRAVDTCFNTMNALDKPAYDTAQCSHLATRTSLYARAAELWENDDKRTSVVVNYAAEMIPNINKDSSSDVTRYCTAICKRACLSFFPAHEIPSELTELVGMDVEELNAIPVWEEHINVSKTHIQCELALFGVEEGSDKELDWMFAKSAAHSICKSCVKYARLYYIEDSDCSVPCKEIVDQLVLRQQRLRCLVGVATDPLPEWDTAIDMCEELQTYAKWDTRELLMIDYFISAADASVVGDVELAALYTKAGHAARVVLKCAVTREDAVKTESLDRVFQEAERRVSALLATRTGHTELASLHSEIADLLLRLNKQVELLGKISKSKSQEVVEEACDLEEKIEKLSAAAVAMLEASVYEK